MRPYSLTAIGTLRTLHDGCSCTVAFGKFQHKNLSPAGAAAYALTVSGLPIFPTLTDCSTRNHECTFQSSYIQWTTNVRTTQSSSWNEYCTLISSPSKSESKVLVPSYGFKCAGHIQWSSIAFHLLWGSDYIIKSQRDESRVHTHDHDGSEAPSEMPDSILLSEPKPLGKHRPPPPPSIMSPGESSYPS
ncbi:hypothetical protein Tco_1315790 [Tanacetum coccineum]